ncbi:MAG: hypothetical protein M3P50_13385, partial [Actinomycetota bacterium]|nr:hypothetical protein [Actinomycetota bacterium]
MSSHPTHPSVLIRAARGSDAEALDQLAALDSAPVLTGDVLLAEVGDRVVAALDTESGREVADPFVATADVLPLLRLRGRPAARG